MAQFEGGKEFYNIKRQWRTHEICCEMEPLAYFTLGLDLNRYAFYGLCAVPFGACYHVLDDASFDHVMVQLMPTQPVDPRSLGLKRNRKEGGDRGRVGGGDRGRGGRGDRGRGGGGDRGRGRKRGKGNVRGGPLNVMDYSSVVADPCGNWFISGSSRGVVTSWDLRFCCIPVNSWQYSLPCPIEKMCLFDPPSGTPLSVATRTLVYVAAVCNEVSLCNAENGSCHQRFYEHGGRHKFPKMLI
ncbi:hypothetical protein OROHE_024344 [Orobanche hederae]